jgi:RNase H-fold protein (predicted Holliday junction resolvase)
VRLLSVDPGRQKCGLAIVDRDAGVLARGVVPTGTIAAVTREWVRHHAPTMVVVGNGTALNLIHRALEALCLPLEVVPEHNTTLRARTRYFKEHPRRGWRRLWPTGLQTPPIPIDDYAAVLIAEDYLDAVAASGTEEPPES